MHNSDREPGKHVIFLGAGASASSGYPLANDLRLRISAYPELMDALNQGMKSCDGSGQPSGPELHEKLKALYHSHAYKHSIDVFRNGCFGSLDEFCKLMSGQEAGDTIPKMKRLTYLALSLTNPEDGFEQSDYYPFVQRLFCEDLKTPREDITIISFNYDVYLDYLLLRAWSTRTGRILDPTQKNQATGGFAVPSDRQWLNGNLDRFRLIKLHGSVEVVDDHRTSAFVMEPNVRVDRVLSLATPNRIASSTYDPPIFFPWEIHNFGKSSSPEPSENPISALISAALKTAQKDIEFASKISFIGLSMNPLLDDTFTKLFSGVAPQLAPGIVVTANGSTDGAQTAENLPPTHPAHRVDRLIRRATIAEEPSSKIPPYRIVDQSPSLGEMRIVPTFADFILEEMAPVLD